MTTFHYDLGSPGDVRILVFDVEGRLVRHLQEPAYRTAGRHTARWDGRDDQGRRVATGVYFYRLQTGDRTLSRKLVVVE
jgi:flagellar hook assembly protein FlgD